MRAGTTSRGILTLTIANGVYTVGGYVLVVLLARILGRAGYGEYGVVAGLITIVNMLVARGLPIAAARAIAAEPTRAPALLATLRSLLVPVVVVIAVTVAAIAWPLAWIVGDTGLARSLALAGLTSVGFLVWGLATAHAQGMQRFGRQAAAQIAYAASRLVAIAGGAQVGGLLGATAGFALSPILGAIPALFGARGDREQREDDRSTMVALSVPLMVTATCSMLLMIVDVYAVKRVASDGAAGIYVAAGTLAHVPFFLLQAAGVVLLPGMAGAATRNERVAFARRGIADTIVLLALPTAMLVAAGDRLVTPVFGPEFASSHVVVAPLAIATAGITLYSAFVALDAGIGRLREAVMIGLTGVVALATAISITARHSNLEAAATSAALVCGAVAIVHALVIRARFGALADPRCLIGIGLSIPLAWPLRLVPDTLPAIALTGAVASGIYLLALRMLGLLGHR